MLPPVLEIYIVWHPKDVEGRAIALEVMNHFHGTIFSGLIGGGVEVYIRSNGWSFLEDAPRPIPFSTSISEQGVKSAQFIAVVPILGNNMAGSVEDETTPWHAFMQSMRNAQEMQPNRVGIFPYVLHQMAVNQTKLGQIITNHYQCIGTTLLRNIENVRDVRCRDLAQGITQLLLEDEGRLTVFVSHTKRSSNEEGENVNELIESIRYVVSHTRLKEFFDASDLQPGQDWSNELQANASKSAFLAVRTDLYPSREWCQKEILIAKQKGMPLIILDALWCAEERGSFLMDHVPRVPARMEAGEWKKLDIINALNLIVDESLKRAIWIHQKKLTETECNINVEWWAPHAPEPVTLVTWFNEMRSSGKRLQEGSNVLILHPDPPLGIDEKTVLNEIFKLSDISADLDVLTPRSLAARGL